jgi:hypothetical protein
MHKRFLENINVHIQKRLVCLTTLVPPVFTYLLHGLSRHNSGIAAQLRAAGLLIASGGCSL